MNRSRYIPFERNRYFYGKLLTVRDFMSEQTYVNDKRRLINRLLFGSGVVSGLQVVAVDEKSVSIETGVALDQMGREIVVPSPVTLKLSMIDGFTNNEYAKNVYLCIAYDEKGKEPVHSVTGVSGRDEEVSEHNRILESYRLFIREQAPNPELQEYDYLINDTSVWYEDAQVRIIQSIPRYLEPGQTFDLTLKIEKTLQTPHVEFMYEPDWTGIEPVEALPDGKVTFSEPTDGGLTSYTKTIRMKALPLPAGETKWKANLSAQTGTCKLIVGERMLTELSMVKQSSEVSEESVSQRILHTFYDRSLDRAIESPAEPCVYLAKINLLQMGATYVIDSVDPLPLQDYVINPTLLYKLLPEQDKRSIQEPSVHRQLPSQAEDHQELAAFPTMEEEFSSFEGEEEEPKQEKQVATGIEELSILAPKKEKWYHRKQRNFFTEEIEHGLGEGPVKISVGISDEKEEAEVVLPEMWNRSDAIYYGPQDVFAKSEYASDFPKVSIGMIHYPKKGTFRIGVRVLQKTERTRLRLRWWAVKAIEDDAEAGSGYHGLEEPEQEAAVSKE